jgi:hypothetical protein
MLTPYGDLLELKSLRTLWWNKGPGTQGNYAIRDSRQPNLAQSVLRRVRRLDIPAVPHGDGTVR